MNSLAASRRMSPGVLAWLRRFGPLVVVALVLSILMPRLLGLRDDGALFGGYVAMMLATGAIIGRWSALWLVLIPTWVTMRTIAAELPSPETATGDYLPLGPIIAIATVTPFILGILGITGGILVRIGALRLVGYSRSPR